MIIDAHHHLWDPARGDYHWMTPEVAVLARPYGPDDLRPQLRRCGVDGTVLVQAAQTRAETDWLLDIAARTDFVLGVVGWLDMEADDFAEQFAAYRANPWFIGLRPMLQDLDDDAWILRPKVLENLALVADDGLPFEFLTFPRHLPHVAEAMRRLPHLHAVIDHLSKPPIRAGELDPWRALMAECARFETLHCKVSGMITEADHAAWRPADLAPFVSHVHDVFGAGRLMFGSDWPVCRLAGEYAEVINAARTVLAELLPPGAHAAVFGGNARAFYRIDPAAHPVLGGARA